MKQHDESSNQVTPFDFHGAEVRVITHDDGEPRWVASDVAKVLGYRDAANMTRNLRDRHKGTQNVSTPAGPQQMTVITEAGLYSAVLKSRVPAAIEFQDWITDEVIPSIRRHGAYLTDQAVEDVLTDPDTLIRLATDLKAERARRADLEQQAALAAPKVEYHDRFVAVDDDVMTIGDWGAHYGLTQPQAFERLNGAGLIYRKAVTREFSGRRGQVVDRNEWRAYAAFRNLFDLRAQHNAPRYHNGQVRQTLYVKASWAFSLARQVGLEDLNGTELTPFP